MKTKYRITFCALISLRLFPLGFAFADGSEDHCRDVLVKTQLSKLDTQLKRIAFLHLIQNQEEFQSSTNIAGGLKAIYDDIPIEATTDYNKFQQWRQSVYEKDEFHLQDDEAHTLQMSFLPDTEVAAWAQCMGVKDLGGIALGVDSLTSSAANIRIHWQEPKTGVGVVISPVTIVENSVQGGKRHGNWPKLRRVASDRDEIVTYIRNKGEDLIVTIEVKGDVEAGGTVTKTIRVPAEPEYVRHCSIDMKSAFRNAMANNTSYSVVCPEHFEPGSKIKVTLAAKFKVDAPGTIWIMLGASICDQIQIPVADVLNIPFWGTPPPPDDTPQSWGFSQTVSVPWDGIVETKIIVGRAEVLPGVQRTLSATEGTLTVDRL